MDLRIAEHVIVVEPAVKPEPLVVPHYRGQLLVGWEVGGTKELKVSAVAASNHSLAKVLYGEGERERFGQLFGNDRVDDAFLQNPRRFPIILEEEFDADVFTGSHSSALLEEADQVRQVAMVDNDEEASPFRRNKSIGAGSGGIGRSSGILYALTHITQLPNKQTGLNASYKNESSGKEDG